ncbi:hypothetical protein O2W18_04935 [Modestobacter sp. VKM Ac-2983]|uniref:hypothetical protein n=1 Tax=Modestobacter sp. VKM Ac-2983 TaxID=3004137 RepID=UPI0022ABA97A|nr:hypothetical protein [Modestobacter sp. VKM Ac-2983]MCZ2804439.1 hypothetical protein [Modestobacter sp. VKM Ac-2983]
MDDSIVLSVSAAHLLDAIRALSRGEKASDDARYLLARCGFEDSGELTEAGLALFRLAWVRRQTEEADRALGQALRQLTPLQVIEQELNGLGPVSEEGVLDLLLQHRAVPAGITIQQLRPVFHWMNRVGVLAYSNKFKTVRSLMRDPDVALPGEVVNLAAMISPRTPFSNLVRLRRLLRPLAGVVWWADPHFGARALEELVEEVDVSKVTEIRILSGNASGVVSDKSARDFSRFVDELAQRGVPAEWRVDAERDWHDRWLVDERSVWNVPPVNTLFKNDYSEILPAAERPPLELWWGRSTPRT